MIFTGRYLPSLWYLVRQAWQRYGSPWGACHAHWGPGLCGFVHSNCQLWPWDCYQWQALATLSVAISLKDWVVIPCESFVKESDRIHVTTLRKRCFTCRQVIVAVPPHEAGKPVIRQILLLFFLFLFLFFLLFPRQRANDEPVKGLSTSALLWTVHHGPSQNALLMGVWLMRTLATRHQQRTLIQNEAVTLGAVYSNWLCSVIKPYSLLFCLFFIWEDPGCACAHDYTMA